MALTALGPPAIDPGASRPQRPLYAIPAEAGMPGDGRVASDGMCLHSALNPHPYPLPDLGEGEIMRGLGVGPQPSPSDSDVSPSPQSSHRGRGA